MLGILAFQMSTLLNPFQSLDTNDDGFKSILEGDFGAWIKKVCYSLLGKEIDQ